MQCHPLHCGLRLRGPFALAASWGLPATSGVDFTSAVTSVQVLAHEHALRGVSTECATLVNAAVKQHMSTILRQCVNLSSQLGGGRTVRCPSNLGCFGLSVGHKKTGQDLRHDALYGFRDQPEQGIAPPTTSSASTQGTPAGSDAALQQRPPITCRDLLTALEVRIASIEVALSQKSATPIQTDAVRSAR